MAQDTSVILDVDFGLEQLSGNAELLAKMLGRFTSDYQDIAAQIQQCLAEGNIADCKAKAHTIKGVAGNLGMWNLYHFSKLLEDAAKTGAPDIDTHLQNFLQSNTATLEEINQYLAGGSTTLEPEPSTTGTSLSADDAKAELRRLLDAFEFIAPEKLDELLSAAGLDEAQKAKVNQAINDLDYPAASELLG